MKKSFGLIVMMFVFVFSGYSQEKGAKWIGGTLKVSSNENGNSTSSSTSLIPEFGVYLNHNWAIGGRAGFSVNKDEQGDATDKTSTVFVIPFARYIFAETGRFNFFGQGELPLNFYGGENRDGSSKESSNSVGLRVRPGLSFDISDKWGFNMLMPSVFSFVNNSNDSSSFDFGVNDGYTVQNYLLNTSIGFVYKF